MRLRFAACEKKNRRSGVAIHRAQPIQCRSCPVLTYRRRTPQGVKMRTEGGNVTKNRRSGGYRHRAQPTQVYSGSALTYRRFATPKERNGRHFSVSRCARRGHPAVYSNTPAVAARAKVSHLRTFTTKCHHSCTRYLVCAQKAGSGDAENSFRPHLNRPVIAPRGRGREVSPA